MPLRPCYLTFDDGPHARGTEVVLQVLEERGIQATFYLTAKNLSSDPELQYTLVKRMLDRGHALGNHGEDHDPETDSQYAAASTEEVLSDFQKNRAHFQKLFERHGEVFPGFSSARLPGSGSAKPPFVEMITQKLRQPHVAWTFEFAPNDHPGLAHIDRRNWQKIQGLRATQDELPAMHSIILGHDAHWGGRADLLRMFIDHLRKTMMFQTLGTPPSRNLRAIKRPPQEAPPRSDREPAAQSPRAR